MDPKSFCRQVAELGVSGPRARADIAQHCAVITAVMELVERFGADEDSRRCTASALLAAAVLTARDANGDPALFMSMLLGFCGMPDGLTLAEYRDVIAETATELPGTPS